MESFLPLLSPGDAMQGEQITDVSSLRNTEWATHNCVLGYPVIGESRIGTCLMIYLPTIKRYIARELHYEQFLSPLRD